MRALSAIDWVVPTFPPVVSRQPARACWHPCRRRRGGRARGTAGTARDQAPGTLVPWGTATQKH